MIIKGWIKTLEITETIQEVEMGESIEIELKNRTDESVSITSDKQIELIVKALSSHTRRQILHKIQSTINGMDVSNIAANLNMTEANISAQIKKLEKAGLIKCDYCSGAHGVRKISKLAWDELCIKI